MFVVVAVAVGGGGVEAVVGVVVVVSHVVELVVNCLVVVGFDVVDDCRWATGGVVNGCCGVGCLFVGSCCCCWWCWHDRCRS